MTMYANYVPAMAGQFNTFIEKGIKYKDKTLDFYTGDGLIEHGFALQSAYYGINEVEKNKTQRFRDIVKYPKDKILIGDSGGFQFLSFMEKGVPCNLDPISSLRWQEKNCDVGMNLDIPPSVKINTYENFKNALELSMKHFAIFEKERQNYDMLLLNVLHGNKYEYMETWYDRAKHFKFDGWAGGVKPQFDPMMHAMAFMFLWEKGEFDKPSCKWYHFFGVSGRHVVPMIVYAAHKLNKNFKITYDSSSYNVGSLFRKYYPPLNIGPALYFGDKFQRENPHITHLPCMCPVCEQIDNFDLINSSDVKGAILLSLHNMYQYIHYNKVLNSLVPHRDLYFEYLDKVGVNERGRKSIEFVDFAFEKGVHNAVKKYADWFGTQDIEMGKQSTIFHF